MNRRLDVDRLRVFAMRILLVVLIATVVNAGVAQAQNSATRQHLAGTMFGLGSTSNTILYQWEMDRDDVGGRWASRYRTPEGQVAVEDEVLWSRGQFLRYSYVRRTINESSSVAATDRKDAAGDHGGGTASPGRGPGFRSVNQPTERTSQPMNLGSIFHRQSCPVRIAPPGHVPMRLRHFVPLVGFVLPTLVIGFGYVIPKSCIAGINELTLGFLSSVLGACLTYWAGVRLALKDREQKPHEVG
jgi:Ni/Co efflux regulator RcnB